MTSAETRDANLQKIVKQKKWIIEGVYSSWTNKSFQNADCIIIIKPNKYVRTLRIAKRYIKTKLRIIDRKDESLKSLFGFLKWNHSFDATKLLVLETKLNAFDDKLLYFKKADHLIAYFKTL